VIEEFTVELQAECAQLDVA